MDLGSLNMDNLENIINSLSQSDIEQLSSIASGFFSSEKQEQPKAKEDEELFDFETVTKIASLLGRLSSQPNDPRCELLSALKPMLSPKRRKKADEAMQMLRLISILPLLQDLS